MGEDGGPPPGAIQITEPIVFEIETPSFAGLPTLTTPPGVGLGGQAISIHYVCPLSIHCGSDTPCGITKTLPLSLSLPLPVFSFPPQFNLPVFGFRFEIPPAIFVKCPFFPEEDVEAQAEADAAAGGIEPEEGEEEVVSNDATSVILSSLDQEQLIKFIKTVSE